MGSGEFLDEDNGAHLVCDTCGQQVRSNEAHECPGIPNDQVVEQLENLRKGFIENSDLNDIPMDQAVQILEEAIEHLGGSARPEEKKYSMVLFIDFDLSLGVDAEEFLQELDYEFRPGENLGNITGTEIVSWSPR